MKTWRLLLALSIGIVLLGTGSGCDTPPPPSVFQTKAVNFDWSGVVTLGNHSYLPINREGNAADMAWDILHMLNTLEESHSHLVVDTWAIEERSNYVCGLWINHHPKPVAPDRSNM